METKNQIHRTLNDFLLEVAGNYSDLIAKDIPPRRFKQVVERVGEARDQTQASLVQICREAVIAAVVEQDAAQYVPIKPVDMVSQLVPADALVPDGPGAMLIGPTGSLTPVPPITEEAITPSYLKELPNAAPGLAPPPRYTDGDPEAPTPMPGGGMLGDEFDADGEDSEYHSPPTTTMAEQSRVAAGLPKKLKRPTVHIDHMGKHEQATQPTAQSRQVAVAPAQQLMASPAPVAHVLVTQPTDALSACFQSIETLLTPHMQSRDPELFGMVCSVMVHVAQGKELVTHLKVVPEAPVADAPEEE